MMNKILVFWGGAFILILIFSSMASSWSSVPFLWMNVSVWILIIYTAIIWIFMWYGLKWIFEKENWDDDNYDF